MTAVPDWVRIGDEDNLPSPALLIHPDRVEENLRRMTRLAGGADRLRPHVKTHKLPQILALELAQGIRKFKAATIAEAEMCAMAGAPDVLLSYQPVGPNVRRLIALILKFPQTRFSCLADNLGTIEALGSAAAAADRTLDVFLDLNVGTNRTGIAPGAGAAGLYAGLARTRGLRPAGLHVFDGHLQNKDLEIVAGDLAAAYGPVWRLRDDLIASGLPVPATVAGGTPTFPLLARASGVELGAGTTVLWDFASAEKCPYLDFLNAAVLVTRVISRPTPNRLCLDLGHKAVASEMPHPRVRLFGLEGAAFVIHNEEHLVVETPHAEEFAVGSVLYGIPRHICPTVALQSEVFVVRAGRVAESWPVVGRARRITV